jgi:formylglycine-generating enzyme required for sulfatase activity
LKYVLLLIGSAFLSICTTAQSSTENFNNYDQSIPGSELKTKMVAIPGGSFKMGSTDSKQPDETPQREVSVSPFWMSAYEVTRDEFDVFFKDPATIQNSEVDAVSRPSAQYIDLSWGMGKEGGFPANSMSQYTALMYCRWLYSKTGIFYRLPSEAEWEYACKAGTTTTYFFGNDVSQLGEYAWFKGNSGDKYQRVGEKKPNAWGLYDMLGNLTEWTLDHYNEKSLQQLTDKSKDPIPAAVWDEYPKVLKGGSYKEPAEELRAANRFQSDPEWNKRDPQIPKSRWWLTDAEFVGFRLLRPVKQPSAEEIDNFFKTYLGQ